MTDPIARASAASPTGRVAPILPLTLLQTVRRRDLPSEVLEGEDLPASLPRRLGLSDVVARQIARYDAATRRGERVPLPEVEDLLRLILRRPDAVDVLDAAGRQLAQAHFERVSNPTRRALRFLPRALVYLAFRRSARGMLRPLAGGGRVEARGRPPQVRIRSSITAAAGENGRACALFSGALEELASLYARADLSAVHTACESRGAVACEWTLSETA